MSLAGGDVERFLREREPRWRRLESILDRVEIVPASAMGPDELQDLVVLYRQASSDLNRARSLTANPDVLARLNRLTGRAYRVVHGAGGRRVDAAGTAMRFFASEAPRTLRQKARHVLAAAASVLCGALLGLLAVLADPRDASILVPRQVFDPDVSQRVERIESGPERIQTAGDALAFGASLYAHNIRVGFLAFALGALTVVLAHVLLFSNGVMLGAVAGQYLVADAQVFFVAWVGPHGALEIPAIVVSAAAGTTLGAALLAPGTLSRRAAILAAAPAACRLLGTAAALFVIAGLIEGSLSQMSAKTIPFAIKIAFAALAFLGLLAWSLAAGRRESAG